MGWYKMKPRSLGLGNLYGIKDAAINISKNKNIITNTASLYDTASDYNSFREGLLNAIKYYNQKK